MKTKMRIASFLFVVLTIGMIISSLAGCKKKASSEESKNSSEEVVLTCIYYGEANSSDVFSQTLEKAVKDFNSANLNKVKIDWQWVAGQTYYDKLNALMAANSVPDIFVCHGAGKMKTYVNAGKTLSLDSFLAEDATWKDSFKSGIFELCQFEGKTYGIPFNQTVSAIFYNKEMFSQYNLTPPKTWGEFLNVCKVLKANGIIPIAIGAKDAWTIGLFSEYISNRLGGNTPYEKIAEGNGDWTDSSFVKAGEMVKNLMDLGYISETCLGDSYVQSASLVTDNKAAMICMGNWVIGLLNEEDSKVVGKMDIFPFPEIEGGKGDKDFWLGQTDNFCISAKTKYPKEAVSFLKWLTSKDFQKAQAEIGGKLPVITDVTIDTAKAPAEFNLVSAAMQNMSGMFIFYDIGLGAKIGDEYNNTMASILVGSKKPAEAFAALQQYTINNR